MTSKIQAFKEQHGINYSLIMNVPPIGDDTPAPKRVYRRDQEPELIALASQDKRTRSAFLGVDLSQEGTPLGKGTNGSRLLSGIGVFKPTSSALGMTQPKGSQMIRGRFGIAPETQAMREVVASYFYRLGVPKTAYVFAPENDSGSLQQYISGSPLPDAAADRVSLISKIRAESIENMVCVDLLLNNTDRNLGNLLVKEEEDGSLTLGLIDHGLIATEKLTDGANLCWLKWNHPVIHAPFSQRAKKIILNHDPADLETEVRDAFTRIEGGPAVETMLQTLRFSYEVLKIALDLNLTPFQVGALFSQGTEGEFFRSYFPAKILFDSKRNTLKQQLEEYKRRINPAICYSINELHHLFMR